MKKGWVDVMKKKQITITLEISKSQIRWISAGHTVFARHGLEKFNIKDISETGPADRTGFYKLFRSFVEYRVEIFDYTFEQFKRDRNLYWIPAKSLKETLCFAD